MKIGEEHDEGEVEFGNKKFFWVFKIKNNLVDSGEKNFSDDGVGVQDRNYLIESSDSEDEDSEEEVYLTNFTSYKWFLNYF